MIVSCRQTCIDLSRACLQILIDASDGASDYGNKFGEPVVAGYTRTFGMRLPNGERREWLKPIMFRCILSQHCTMTLR